MIEALIYLQAPDQRRLIDEVNLAENSSPGAARFTPASAARTTGNSRVARVAYTPLPPLGTALSPLRDFYERHTEMIASDSLELAEASGF